MLYTKKINNMIQTDYKFSNLQDNILVDIELLNLLQKTNTLEESYDQLLDNINSINKMTEEQYILSIAKF